MHMQLGAIFFNAYKTEAYLGSYINGPMAIAEILAGNILSDCCLDNYYPAIAAYHSCPGLYCLEADKPLSAPHETINAQAHGKRN